MPRKEGPTPPREYMEAIKKSLKKPASPKGTSGKAAGPAKAKAKASTSYSPAPMSAAAKKKAAAAGKATGAKTKPKSLASKVVSRAKTVAREVRDVKTALGTSLRDQEQNVRRAAMGVGPTKKNVGGNLKKQIKEVGSAIKSGKKGTSSDMYNKPGAYKSGTKRK